MQKIPDEARLNMLRELPPLMPEFLRKRRAGLPAVRELANSLGIDPVQLHVLRLLSQILGSYGGEPVTPAQIRAFDPYSTKDDLMGEVARLQENGRVREEGQGRLALSTQAEKVVEGLHRAGRAHVAAMQPLPPSDLDRLADLLQTVVAATVADPVLMPRPGSHLASGLSLAASTGDMPAMVRIEQSIFALWMARDDAHIAAWRAAGLEGPPLPVLTHIWRGEAGTIGQLVEHLASQQTPQDIEGNLAYLIANEYVSQDGDRLTLTPTGSVVYGDIEGETDRLYFASWPLTLEEARWLRDKLRELVENLPAPPLSK